ncbi:hypothetical protein A2Z22_02595 [Candidatus Woesebacteria bacterium RBG_16_34_12]|uniref:Uncharacterized protein n=1 Tax=Candidatus Woesebacteria bacterium RBG_16_34_12 TaxID=1802480 RepID=A0A1F7X6P6_9BACT|nr:MAG: hypothetical protein A2Z22_02595 [Candidatus Woesebacteria bacterium RBG_16_34_12]
MTDNKIVQLKNKYQEEARKRAMQSERWKTFFNLALIEKIQPWETIAFIYDKKSGRDLSQKTFVYERIAKILAAIDHTDKVKSLHSTLDLINWNRKAILAMIEVSRKHNEQKSIQRGEKALELINFLFPEFLLKK